MVQDVQEFISWGINTIEEMHFFRWKVSTSLKQPTSVFTAAQLSRFHTDQGSGRGLRGLFPLFLNQKNKLQGSKHLPVFHP